MDGAVISTDALIYGGLVASRTHNIPLDALQARVTRLKNLKMDTNIRFYGFSTLMRTPRESYGNVEPAYYSDVGPAIFKYSQLADKSDVHAASLLEDFESGTLERNMAKTGWTGAAKTWRSTGNWLCSPAWAVLTTLP